MGELPTGAQAGLARAFSRAAIMADGADLVGALHGAILAALLLALVSLLERLTFKRWEAGHDCSSRTPSRIVLTGLAGMGVAFIAVFLAHGGGGMLLWLCALAAWLPLAGEPALEHSA